MDDQSRDLSDARLNGSPDSGRVYRTRVGCLRICKDGPVAVVYPEGTSYAALDGEGLKRVIDEDLGPGQPVTALQIGSNGLPR